MAAVEMSRCCNIIWEWGIKVISLKNCSLSQGTVWLNAGIYFWWTLFDPWVLVLVGCWGSSLVSQDAPALAFQLRARFGFGSDSASRAPWALICCQSSCQVETQHLLPESTQRRHCRRRPWSVGPGWNDSSETAQKRWFVETWFSPQTSVSAALVAVVRLDFLRFHFQSPVHSRCVPWLSPPWNVQTPRKATLEEQQVPIPVAVSVNSVLEVSRFPSA